MVDVHVRIYAVDNLDTNTFSVIDQDMVSMFLKKFNT